MYMGPYNIIDTPSSEYRQKSYKLVSENLVVMMMSTFTLILLTSIIPFLINDVFKLTENNFLYEFLITVIVAVIEGPLLFGYIATCVRLSRGEHVEADDAFWGFNYLGTAFVTNIIMNIYILLWSLLLIIPGIVKSYAYRFTFFIMFDHPGLTPSEAIAESVRITNGNKGKMFCLEMSFIGWYFISWLLMFGAVSFMEHSVGLGIIMIIAFVIYSLWLNSYIYVALASLYNDVIEDRTNNYFDGNNTNTFNYDNTNDMNNDL